MRSYLYQEPPTSPMWPALPPAHSPTSHSAQSNPLPTNQQPINHLRINHLTNLRTSHSGLYSLLPLPLATQLPRSYLFQ